MPVNSVIVHTYGRQYSRDSFNRFGDDLTELLLSFMTFEDKIRLQFVCRQWRRLIFKKTFDVTIIKHSEKTKNFLTKIYRRIRTSLKSSDDNSQEMISYLKKNENIRSFSLKDVTHSKELSLIGQYCPHIKTLYYRDCYNNDKNGNALKFFRQYGHKLERLRLVVEDEEVKQILEFCPNLKRLKVSDTSALMTGDKKLLPKLEHVKSYLFISVDNLNQFQTFTDKYSQTLKTLYVSFDDLNEEELQTCIDCMSRFVNLRVLKLSISSLRTTESIDDCLSLIGQKCTKLLIFYLNLHHPITISKRFFNVFTEFKAIKKLNVILNIKQEVNGSVECFKHCKQLKQLDIQFLRLKEEFFANIDKFVPNLQLLSIINTKKFSDSFIDSFRSMKSIRKVSHKCYSDTTYGSIEGITWYFGKYYSEIVPSSIVIFRKPFVTMITVIL